MPPENTIVATSFALPTYIFQNGQVTGNNWTNPENIFLVDGDVAVSNANQGSASDFTVGGYNFLYQGISIPEDAVIVGIEFEVIGYRGEQTSPVITLDISLYDNVNGANDFYPYVSGFTGLTPETTTTLLGTPTYLFASSFSVDQIKNIKMNLSANGDISLDSLPMRVYFYVPGDTTPADPVTPGVCIDCSSPIQVQAMYLALPFLSGETKFYLQKGSFAYPNGVPVQPGDVGSCGGKIPLVFDESRKKENGNFEENAEIDTNDGGVWQVLASGIIEVDIGSVTHRGLGYSTPGTHVAANMSNHDANSKVIISNNTPYNLTLLRTCQADTVFSPPIEVDNEDVPVTTSLHRANFSGPGVSVSPAVSDPLHDVDIIIPGAGGTTPPQVASSVSATSGATPSDTIELDLPITGLNRGAIFQLSTEEGVTVSSIFANGDPMTLVISETDPGNNLRNEQYAILAPALGTLNIVCVLSADASWSAGAEGLVGVNQTDFIGASSSNTGNDNNPTVSLNTTVDYSLVIDGLTTAQTPILYTEGAGQTSNWKETANADLVQGGSSVEAAGLTPDAIISDYSITQLTPWVMTSVEIIGITADTGTALTVKDIDGVPTVNPVNVIRFPNGAVIDDGAGQVTISFPGAGQSAIQFKDEGTNLGASGTANVVNFVGAGVTATRSVNTITVTIPGGGGTSLEVQQDGVTVETAVDTINITGDGATVTNPSPGQVNIDITAGSGGSSAGTKLAVDTTQHVVSNTATLTLLYSGVLPGGRLGTNNAVKFKVQLSSLKQNSGASNSLFIRLVYGSTTTLLTIASPNNDVPVTSGYIEGYIVGNGATNAQKIWLTLKTTSSIGEETTSPTVIISKIQGSVSGTAAVDSTTGQTLQISAQWQTANVASALTSEWTILEIISDTSESSEKKVGVGTIGDVNWFNIQLPFSMVNSTDSQANVWTLSGGTQVSPSMININSGDTVFISNDQQNILPDLDSAPDFSYRFDSTKQGIFQCSVYVSVDDPTQNEGGMGFYPFLGTRFEEQQGTNNTGIGFIRDSNGQWYARAADGGGHTETAISITDDAKHVFRCEYDPANSTPQVRYYVDGILLATVTGANLPIADTGNIIWSAGNNSTGVAFNSVTCPSFAVEI